MDAKEIHLRDYLHVILKRRFTIITVMVIVSVLTLIITFSTTPIYESTTKLYIEKIEPAAFLKDYGYSFKDPEFLQTQFELIKSLAVSRRVVEILSNDPLFLESLKDDSGGYFTSAKKAVSSKENEGSALALESGMKSDEQTIGSARKIARAINVSPVRNSKIINISFRCKDPDLAQMVANTVAKAYIDTILEMRMSFSKYTIEWMAEKVDEERERLDEYERNLQQYMQQNDIVTLEDRLAIIPDQLSELSTKRIRAETERKELEVLYQKLQEFSSTPDKADAMPVVASDSTVRSIREQILKKEQEVIELSKKYGKKHPQMIRTLSDLAVLREKKLQEINRVIESIKNEYELSISNEASLKEQLARTKATAINMSEKFVQYEILKREAETSRHLYDSLLKKIKEQSITEEIKDVNIWIVEKARRPGAPIKPHKSMNILSGIFFGLLGGIGTAFFIEYLDNTIKSADEAEAKLKAPVLGLVAFLKPDKDSLEKRIQTIVHDEPKSPFAESFKGLRTAIMLSSADAPPKHILITSMGPGEGKTTTAINLALAVAQAGRKVLLVDADLRRPTIHKTFELPNSQGLSTYLAGNIKEIETHKGRINNLDIITSGPIPPNPSELLDSERFLIILNKLGEEYDFIICDSPPMLSVTDPIILSKRFQGTVIVARAGKTPYEAVRKGLRQLNDINVHVLGLFINAYRLHRTGYYYGHYDYYYSYAYAYKETDSKSSNAS